MSAIHTIVAIARADFLERARRYSFLITLAATLYLAYQIAIGNVGMSLGNYRGVLNSAWLGIMLAMCTSTFVSLVGFYIVKNTIERDRHTGVGQILAATPLSRFSYLAGKAISNFLVLAVILAILAAAAFPMLYLGGAKAELDLWQLLAPLFFLTLPALAFVACLVTVFECIPGLRSGFGNAFYIFFWEAMFVAGFLVGNQYADVLGVGLLKKTVLAAAKARLPDYNGGFSLGAIGAVPHLREPLKEFLWEGVHWTAGLILPRLLLYFYAAGCVVIAALLFDRFDPSRGLFHRVGVRLGISGVRRTRRSTLAATEAAIAEEEARESTARVSSVHLSPLPAAAASLRFGAILRAELRLLWKGRSKWWYLVACGLLVGTFAAPAGEAQGKFLAFAWIWPVLLWSSMGTREARYGTGALIFSSPRALSRQLPAAWMAGVTLALVTGAGVGFRLLLARQWPALGAWLIGAMFIPAMALALGVWSGTSKLFEGLYTAFWYVGPLQNAPGLDFMGISPRGVAQGVPVHYLFATAALLAVAWLGRRRQIRS
jgi:hypothetical protein